MHEFVHTNTYTYAEETASTFSKLLLKERDQPYGNATRSSY